MTFVMTSLENIQAGFNSCFIVRYLLEKANSTENALLLLMKLPVASNCNILIADKNGEMIVVECTPSEKRIRKAVSMDNGKIVCTVNSFTSDEMKRHDAAKGNDYHSAKRYDTVMESFSTHIKGNLIGSDRTASKKAIMGLCANMMNLILKRSGVLYLI